MSSGQWRVFVLLLVLLGLEILRSGPVHSFFSALFSKVNVSLPATSTPGSTGTNNQPNTNYPPGSKGSKPQ